jgi:hypothetical protein
MLSLAGLCPHYHDETRSHTTQGNVRSSDIGRFGVNPLGASRGRSASFSRVAFSQAPDPSARNARTARRPAGRAHPSASKLTSRTDVPGSRSIHESSVWTRTPSPSGWLSCYTRARNQDGGASQALGASSDRNRSRHLAAHRTNARDPLALPASCRLGRRSRFVRAGAARLPWCDERRLKDDGDLVA